MKFKPHKIQLILSGVSAIGVIATAVTAVRATPRAIELIRSDSRTNHDGDPDAYTKAEAVKSAWKCYILPVTIGTATIACIFGSTAMSKKQQASLVSAYALMSESYREYTKKVKDICGEDTHKRIIDEIAKENANPDTIMTPGIFGATTLDFNSEMDEVPHLFYDAYTKRYFESTISKVLKAEYHLNRNFTLGGYLTLNDYLEFLGLERDPAGDDVGWDISDGYTWIDFDHHTTYLDDDLECYVIEMVFMPSPLDGYE